MKRCVALTGGTHEAADSDEVGFAEINGAVFIDLGRKESTSQIESWTDE